MMQHSLQPAGSNIQGQATILIIENDRNNRILMENLLGIGGYVVVSASNGQEALELLDRGVHIDLALMDLVMPVLDGYQAARMIRAKAGYERLPIVAVTGYPINADKASVLEADCIAYLTKPFRHQDLLDVVARLLRR
jgi:CheY-like chemotaxis protein